MNKPIVAALLAVFAFVFWGICCMGCDSFKEAKDRAALLACVNNGGVRSWSMKTEYLEVVCKDGTNMLVNWIPK
jgi:hypothetical protein